MKLKVIDAEEFKRSVFGGECFLNNFPDILTDGVEVMYDKHSGWYYILENGYFVDETAFFTEEDMQYLERCSD